MGKNLIVSLLSIYLNKRKMNKYIFKYQVVKEFEKIKHF